MSQLHPVLDAELAGDEVTIFGAVELAMPGGAVRVLDGSAELTFLNMVFTGDHPVFGSLNALDEISDGAGDEAPGLTVTMLPSPDATSAELRDARAQGGAMRFWIGARNDRTGAVIGQPFQLFDGEIDVPTLVLDERERTVEFDGVGGMERFFDIDEGINLSTSFHERVWPGELGCAHVTGVADTVYWGQSAPSGVRI